MPKYVFECPDCDLQFSRSLKMGEHPHHSCPNCGSQAERQWKGNGFGFGFAEGKTPGNSGVTKDDYPTADHAVGKSADRRWIEVTEREKAKEKVREASGHRALNRTHGPGNKHIEYKAGGEALVKVRKKLADGVNKRLLAEAESGR